jgi:urea carboxylase
MEKLQTLLIANRGEIATRLIRTARALNIRTVSIYTAADASSTHVSNADVAIQLEGPDSKAYLDGEQIVRVAKDHQVDAVIPGYGFLSENTAFAASVRDAGMAFVGPSAKAIEAMGIKHTARSIAVGADVPVVPGTKGLVDGEEEAVAEAQRLGFPVMLKATAGGGGMGLLTCENEEDVRASFKTVQSRGEALFKNAGLFIERYYPESHHVEVQVFGNGAGKAIHFGERECSIQRRHQKVIEECPSPFVTRHPELRAKLCAAAVRLAESIEYGSAGTVEYLVDDVSADFFFLEMNTRLQVEHGITELCYGVDLVELMLRQADAELQGKKGLDPEYLASLQPTSGPQGAAVEVRIYAENPARDYAPSPGTLQDVHWADLEGARIDTWIHRGTKVSANYDPLLAKAMVHRPAREEALKGMIELLRGSRILGPPTNLDFLACVLQNDSVQSGHTLTRFLARDFTYNPAAIDVLQGGAYTLVQDWPGRPTIGRGFSHAGPMDPLAFRIANALVGNAQSVEGLEITLSGPDLRFLGRAVVALCGAPIKATLDGHKMPMWTRVDVPANARLSIGKTTAGGCRAYLAVYGGLPSIATWFGSKATAPMTGVGGYQGRALAAGDLLGIVPASQLPSPIATAKVELPNHLRPDYPSSWRILAMPGPYDEGYLTRTAIDALYAHDWRVSHNAARGGIRLLLPPEIAKLRDSGQFWARDDGGEGGAHPSNVIEYGYPVGGLNWTGDDPVLFPVDAPDLGGFVCALTVPKAEFWRMGQMKAGDKLRMVKASYEDATERRERIEEFLTAVERACTGEESWDAVKKLSYEGQHVAQSQGDATALIEQIPEKGNNPVVSYRQGGDDFVLVDYGHGDFDLNWRCRAVALYGKLKEAQGELSFSAGTIYTGMACGNSLMIYYDSMKVRRASMMSLLLKLEDELGDLSAAKFPSRVYRLPIAFNHTKQKESLKRYMETQRAYASYLPDPADFVAKNNAFSEQQVSISV